MDWIEEEGVWVPLEDETEAVELKKEQYSWILSAGCLEVTWDSREDEVTKEELLLATSIADGVLAGFNRGYEAGLAKINSR